MTDTDGANAPVAFGCDVVIVGCGVAGLYAALNLPVDTQVVMLSKGALEECDSMLAQGGICVLPEAGDYDAFVADTLRAGHGENRRESVDIMVRSSRSVINDLLALGVAFEREEDGSLAFTREGAHSRPRIAYHADITGQEITTRLLEAVRQLPNVRILEHVAMTDLMVDPTGACCGVEALRVPEERSTCTVEELRALAAARAVSDAREVGFGTVSDGFGTRAEVRGGAEPERGATAAPDTAAADESIAAAPLAPFAIRAHNVLLATGGIGGVYEHSTNYPQLTGDACLLAHEYDIAQENLDYVQIHPTGLYSSEPGRTFLISESCRGEGAVLLNAARERFTDELQPRDVVARAIQDQMRADGAEFEWLSFAPVPRGTVLDHFANIRAHCLECGRDILDEPIPVVPTQHYFMGGVRVDRDSATSMPHLYAAGEASCNGVHGRNRLASNSLLEALVFARRAAWCMATGASLPVEPVDTPPLDGRHRRLGEQELGIDTLTSAQGSANGEEAA